MLHPSSLDNMPTRVDVLRQKLEQYNAGIARAMNEIANAAPAGPTAAAAAARLVPPSLTNAGAASSYAASHGSVARDLGAEFYSAAADVKATSRSQGTDATRPQRQSASAEVLVEEGDAFDDDEEAPELETPASDEPESDNVSEADFGVVPGMAPVLSEGAQYRAEKGRVENDSAVGAPPPPPPPLPSASPSPKKPVYDFRDLESAYHRVVAVHEGASIFSSFPKSSIATLIHDERLASLYQSRDELLRRDSELRSDRAALMQQRQALGHSEADFKAMIDHLSAECEAAKKTFSAVYERKAILYAKEKQLDQLALELQKLQSLAQNRRATLSAVEARAEQRRRAVTRREEQFDQSLASHSSREEELRKKVEKVETLNGKIVSWIKILETRESELTSKEQRLKAVQLQLNRRAAELQRRRAM